MDHQHTISNLSGPSASEIPQLRIEVTVLRALNIKKRRLLKNRVFVTVTNREMTKKTRSVSIEGRAAQWDQKLDAFYVQPSSDLVLCLYAERLVHTDTLIGMHQIPIPVESQIDIPVVFSHGDGQAGQSIQPVMLYLTITVSAEPNPTNPIASEVGGSPPTHPSMTQDPIKGATASEPLSPPTDHVPTETSGAVPSFPDVQAVVSPTEDALHDADEAIKAINTSDTWEGAIARIQWMMDTFSAAAGLHPYAQMACGLLLAIPKTLLEQFQNDDNVRTLLVAVHDAFDFANQENILRSIKRESRQARILTLMLQHVCNCCDLIRSYANDSQFWKRTLKNIGGRVNKQIDDLRTALLELRRAFLDEATITTEITTLQILDDVGTISAMISNRLDGMVTQLKWVSSQVSDVDLDAKIRDIPYGTGSRFVPEKGCLPGTRTAFLDLIVDWVNNPDSERGLVLLGQAGTGKSSIAHEIAHRFDKMHRLTSSFIFLRKEQSQRDAYKFFTTLARDLSDRYPSFKTALGRIVKDDSSLRVRTRDYPTLFESLVLHPLEGLHIVGPILVVIDALDESGDTTGRNGLHAFLSKNIFKLPSNFRVLITSRPEDGILSAFNGAPSTVIKYMNDSELAARTEDDILTFLQMLLPSDVFEEHGVALTRKAEGLFQWAAVAGGFIVDPPECFGFSKKKCINHLLRLTTDRDGQDPLDELYKEVLEGYFTHPQARLLFRSVVGQLITAFEPLSICSLTTLRRLGFNDDDDADSVAIMLGRLGSLLSNVNSSDDTLPILPLHASFRDFLTNKEKSGDFSIPVRDAHHELAHSCLGLVLRDLRFNMCHIESSYLANRDIQDLEARVAKHMSPALLYACRFYDDHFEHLSFDAGLFDKLQAFFGAKFLFWLEALSLVGDMRLALPALSSLNVWLASGRGSQQVSAAELEKLTAFINDATAFVRYFGIAMAKSAPHVYLSTLPFAPTCSLVSMHYSSMFPRTLRVESGRLSHWPSSEMVISNVGGYVMSTAFSPDDQRIVSGSYGGGICVWNATTGERVAGPFIGNTMSVAFSPDGQRVASGMSDSTIHVWDAMTGEIVVGPCSGHTLWVTSVAFSPDGQSIVSGSADQTIRVWKATTGEAVAGPLSGHTDHVTSVTFSPDSQRIVSGSVDRTIRIWNSTTGETVGGPYSGHTHWVNSVAFSPDGQRVISGSEDKTIRVWSAVTGETMAGPFSGHTGSVESVAFSADSRLIVSGSFDRTIRVWDAITGAVVAGPFSGHTEAVESVTFSSDGQRVISGSQDGTIRVWNVTTGGTAAGGFDGHRGLVTRVAFSPDGKRVVSGSHDQTIRVWNAMTGQPVTSSLIGHTNLVRSVAFSPDGQRVVSASDDSTIRVWNATTGEMVAGPFSPGIWAPCVAFSPDGKRIVSFLNDGSMFVWDVTTGETMASLSAEHQKLVGSVAFSPDGQRIVSGSYDETIVVWNVITGEIVAGPFSGHTDAVTSVIFTPDGQRVVSGSNDSTIRVWDASTGETVAGPFSGHIGRINSVAISPDGQCIASGSGDQTIRMWDPTTGEPMAGSYCGHTHSVRSVAFSPDGQRIVSSAHGSIRMLDVTTCKTENTGQVDFTYRSKINEEGWICGSNDELLMWIPPLHRDNLHRPGDIWVVGEHETRLCLSDFAHGHSWDTCIET